eukprot:Gb_00629 [translate_table: standard]
MTSERALQCGCAGCWDNKLTDDDTSFISHHKALSSISLLISIISSTASDPPSILKPLLQREWGKPEIIMDLHSPNGVHLFHWTVMNFIISIHVIQMIILLIFFTILIKSLAADIMMWSIGFSCWLQVLDTAVKAEDRVLNHGSDPSNGFHVIYIMCVFPTLIASVPKLRKIRSGLPKETQLSMVDLQGNTIQDV